jgi:hypothetical protein
LDAPTEGGAKGRARTDPPSRVLKFDFPSFKVGVAEYEEGPTGCTVFHFPEGAASAIDVRGGNVGKNDDHEFNHAICLAGGSLPGLEAAAELWDRGGVRSRTCRLFRAPTRGVDRDRGDGGAAGTLREKALAAYDRFIGLELLDVAVDGCITKAPCGGEKAGRSPVDKGKQGIKRSAAVDASGIPRPSEGCLRGVHLDRGYDSDLTRDPPEARGGCSGRSPRRLGWHRSGPPVGG